MDEPRNPLARLPDHAYVPRSQILYNASVHDPQYTVDPTALGDYAIHFTAEWLAGQFSVTDLSPEWVAFIQQSIRGGWGEWSYAGAAPFSNVPWDSPPWDDRVTEWVFSQVRLEPGTGVGGILGEVVESMRDADVGVWDGGPKRLPFHKTLALPDAGTTTISE